MSQPISQGMSQQMGLSQAELSQVPNQVVIKED